LPLETGDSMKTKIYSKIGGKSYKDILQTTEKVSFEKFTELRKNRQIDFREMHFVMPEIDHDNDFGYFEIEKDIPSYRYNIFFEPNCAK